MNTNFIISESGAKNWKVSKIDAGRTKRVFVSCCIGGCFDYVISVALDETKSRNDRLAAVYMLRAHATNRVVEMLDMAHEQALLEHAWYNENCEELPTGHQCDIDEDGYCRDARCPKSCDVDIEEAAAPAAEPSPEPAAVEPVSHEEQFAEFHGLARGITMGAGSPQLQEIRWTMLRDLAATVTHLYLLASIVDYCHRHAIEEDYQLDREFGFACKCGELVKDEGQSCGSCASDAVMYAMEV